MKVSVLCFFLLSLSSAHAEPIGSQGPEAILLRPPSQSASKFLFSYHDYQDIRVDSNHDGRIDLWILKKGNLQISSRYDNAGKLSFVHFRRISGKDVVEALYTPQNHGFRLQASGKRPLRVMRGSVTDACITSKQNVFKELQQFTGQLSRQSTAIAVENLFDSDCAEAPYYEKGAKALTDVIESAQDKDSFMDCLEKEDFKKQFPEDQALAVDALSAQLRLNLSRMARGQNNPQIKIRCEVSEDAGKISGAFKENGEFLLQASAKDSPMAFQKLFLHELLHQAGTPDDQFIDLALKSCLARQDGLRTLLAGAVVSRSYGIIHKNADKAAQETAQASEANIEPGKALSQVPVTLDDAKKSINEGNISAELNMTKEIAVSQPLPTGEQLASSGSESGSESGALSMSASQSAPVLRMANQVMGSLSTPAVAANAASDASAESSSSSARSKASRSIASEGSAKVSIPSRNALKADEKVVEQIEIGEASDVSVASSASERASSNQASKSVSRTPASINAKARSLPADVAKNAEGGMSSSGSATSSLNLATESKTSSNARAATTSSDSSSRRRPASVSASVPADSSGRDEVVTFFSKGEYSLTKSKLKDQNFVNKLKDNKISIVDLYGNSYGADRGDVIFLDEGNRFVRQK